MKLSDRKIESLAKKLTQWLESNKDVHFLVETDEIYRAIIEEFQDEKETERNLDDEVEKVMSANEAVMSAEGVDTWVMRKKVRQQIARQKGIII